MRVLRLIPLFIGWNLLNVAVVISWIAAGVGWLGECIINMAFEERKETP
jgi:hypothetical protein